jgi:hypothetical protein
LPLYVSFWPARLMLWKMSMANDGSGQRSSDQGRFWALALFTAGSLAGAGYYLITRLMFSL